MNPQLYLKLIYRTKGNYPGYYSHLVYSANADPGYILHLNKMEIDTRNKKVIIEYIVKKNPTPTNDIISAVPIAFTETLLHEDASNNSPQKDYSLDFQLTGPDNSINKVVVEYEDAEEDSHGGGAEKFNDKSEG